MESKSQRELRHALNALQDGSGWEEWGPGPVGLRLFERDWRAAFAFDAASVAVHRLMRENFGGPLSPLKQVRFIAAMRDVAPMLLRVLEGER